MMVFIQDIRSQFPALAQQIGGKPLIYLDNAATTQKPQSVLDAIMDYYIHSNANVGRSVHHLANQATKMVTDVRQVAASFLHAKKAEEIIFTAGATAGLNLLASAYGAHIKEGDEIVLSAMEHHSNLLPWQALCRRKKAILRVIPLLPAGDLDLVAFSQLLTPRTKLVALTYVSNVLGSVNPLKEMIQQAHAVGAVVVVDAAQAIPHITVDVQRLECDFLVFSGHKAYGPTGIGVLYGKEEALDLLSPYQLGGGMVESVDSKTPIYAPMPHRLEAGTLHLAGIAGLGAALRFLKKVGYEAIENHETTLLSYAKQRLASLPGLVCLGNPNVQKGLFSFTIEGHHPLDIGLQLHARGMALRTGQHCAAPLMEAMGVLHAVRVSFGIYNTIGEIDALEKALQQLTF